MQIQSNTIVQSKKDLDMETHALAPLRKAMANWSPSMGLANQKKLLIEVTKLVGKLDKKFLPAAQTVVEPIRQTIINQTRVGY